MSDRSLPECLYHYTDLAGLKGIIDSNSLWATHIRSLNDVSEILYSRGILASLAKRLEQEFRSDVSSNIVLELIELLSIAPTSPDTFVVALCEDGDNLGQWRAYGGFAIGFNRERLAAVSQFQEYSLIRIIYDEGEQVRLLEGAIRESVPIMTEWLANPADAPSALMQGLLLGHGLTIAMLWVKNSYFKDEREWRLARVFLPDEIDASTRMKSGVEIPYVEFSLSQDNVDSPIAEIITGPFALSDASQKEILEHLEAAGLEDVPIRSSSIPLRRS